MPHMSLPARKEYLIRIKKRYPKASWKEKGQILDEFCDATGMNRKYVIDCLSVAHVIRLDAKRRHGKRETKYDNEFVFFLKKIWEILDYPCGDRLKPILPEMVRKMRQFHELEIPESVAEKFNTVSHSTIDTKLSRYKKDLRRRIQGQTKPGSLLKKQIPIRTSSWEETEPGYAELDTVAHCGDSAAGEFAITLNRFFVTHFTRILKHTFAVHSRKLIQFRHPIFHVHRCAFLGFNFSKIKKGGHQTIQPKEFVFG